MKKIIQFIITYSDYYNIHPHYSKVLKPHQIFFACSCMFLLLQYIQRVIGLVVQCKVKNKMDIGEQKAELGGNGYSI